MKRQGSKRGPGDPVSRPPSLPPFTPPPPGPGIREGESGSGGVAAAGVGVESVWRRPASMWGDQREASHLEEARTPAPEPYAWLHEV